MLKEIETFYLKSFIIREISYHYEFIPFQPYTTNFDVNRYSH
jgi:hypothetical protein